MEQLPSFALQNASVAPSRQYSDFLYHFDKRPDRIIAALQNKGFTLNYVIEDFSYLGTNELSKVAFPMLCFCDIESERSRLEPHKELYGHYGIGLTKEWGRKHGVQPVHYIVPSSPFAQDLKQAIEAAMSIDFDSTQSKVVTLSDFLITTIAYAKPLWGMNNGKSYCFEDECEWRLIPNDLSPDLPRLIPNPGKDQLDNYRGALWMSSTYLLEFDYRDISDIFVEKGSRQLLCNEINCLDISDEDKDLLKTRIREE